MGKFMHREEKQTMTRRFLKRVITESIVDTKMHRYIYNTGNIERLPLEKLNTTYALTDWEVVGNVRDL